jgi:hypothetical protein
MPRALLAAALALTTAAPAAAQALRVYPPDVPLTGPGASQRLLVLADLDGVTLDVTEKAAFASSRPEVAAVNGGVVRAVADGEATLTVRLGEASASVKVTVRGAKGPGVPSFRNDVRPVLTRAGCNSGACHGALAGKGGLKLSLRGYDPDADHFVLTRQAQGRRVDLREPARSLILLKPTNTMPHGGGLRLPPGSPDYRVLADWLAAGAPGPRADDPRIKRLEVFPPAAVLRPKDTLRVLVRAWYGDGHAADVTSWAKFNSSEDLVAAVDANGKLTVAGRGEAAVTVWFSDLVATTRVAVPLPDPIDPKVFADAPRRNFIDDLVLKKLQTLRIPPSLPCTDEEFVRRAFLDATGTLPTPQEVESFLADKGPDKRERLIDALLERPEYVDYWSYKWSDLLLVNSRRLPQPAVWAYYQFVRQSVADNRPWDRFARDVLTVNGSALREGAANYFVLHKDVTDLAETTTLTFMGTSLTCARCHNHPLEKWTQDQYWAFANLFGRVGLKNGDRAGDVVVQSRPGGEVPHLRRGVPMPPTPLDGVPLAFDDRRDRRAYLADWLTAPGNPYFARALVNRVWRNFMGRGLVEAEDDLRETNPPTNPELLDALADDFVKHGFDVKHVARTVMRSAAYQRSSRPLPANAGDDRFYSRYLVRRLSAEVLLDAYAQVTGVPTPFNEVGNGTGGTRNVGEYPPGTRALQLPDTLVVSRFLDAFGRPERGQTCSCERQDSPNVGQALHVNNGKTLNDKLRAKGSRVEAWTAEKVNDEEAVRRLFLLALSRRPTEAELARCKALLAEAAADKQTTRREALEDLFWGVLTSREFLFNR